MKINPSILAAALGLASVSLASATQYVYLTGSTAARDAVYTTITNGNAVFDAAPLFIGYGSTTPGSTSFMEFSNTIAGTPTIIKCAWSGSEAGIADVSGSGTESFLADPGTAGLIASGATTASSSGLLTDVEQVEVAQADNAKAYSSNPTSTASEIFDQLAIPFVFVKATNEITDQGLFTTVTDDNFKNLASGGDLLAVFTGNAADVNNYVYLAGRDNNSGTRVNTLDITGYGSKRSVAQIELSAGAMVQFGSPAAYQGNGGQSSGGTLAKSLSDTTLSTDQVNGGTGFIAVAYLGLSDDATAEGAPFNAIRLNYNGVPYTTANVENGLYTFWGKEYTLIRSGAPAIATTVANSIVAHIQANTSGFEIPYSQMNVDRSGPTTQPTHD
jgi:hypothetical protein